MTYVSQSISGLSTLDKLMTEANEQLQEVMTNCSYTDTDFFDEAYSISEEVSITKARLQAIISNINTLQYNSELTRGADWFQMKKDLMLQVAAVHSSVDEVWALTQGLIKHNMHYCNRTEEQQVQLADSFTALLSSGAPES